MGVSIGENESEGERGASVGKRKCVCKGACGQSLAAVDPTRRGVCRREREREERLSERESVCVRVRAASRAARLTRDPTSVGRCGAEFRCG